MVEGDLNKSDEEERNGEKNDEVASDQTSQPDEDENDENEEMQSAVLIPVRISYHLKLQSFQ